MVPIYNRFVEQAKSLDPRLLAMVTPSRWMAGGMRLDDYRQTMLKDQSIRVLVDFPDAGEAFPGVDIKGGVSYFLRDSSYQGPCDVTTVRQGVARGPVERRLDEFDVLVRDDRALGLLRRVLEHHAAPLADVVSTRDPFGPALSSNFTGYHQHQANGDLRLYMNQAATRGDCWVAPDVVTKNHQLIDVWKVLMPKAGPGNSGGHVLPDMVLGKPLVAEPGSVCTLSYLVVGPLATEGEARSVASYLATRFARFLVALRKPSQDAPRGVYSWVPQQAWDRTWTDEELFEKYAVTEAEANYIQAMVRTMADGE